MHKKKEKRKRTTTAAQEGCCKQQGESRERSGEAGDGHLPGPYSHNRYFALRRVLIYAFFSMEKYTHTHAADILSAASCVLVSVCVCIESPETSAIIGIVCHVKSTKRVQVRARVRDERVFLLCFWVIY